MVDIASREVQDTISPKKKAPASRRGYSGGVVGGEARAKALTDTERSDIARIAALARWKRKP